MTAKMKQLVVVAVVGLVLLLALLGEVSARRHKRSTKRLMNWEQQRLEVDKKYFATVMSDYEDLNSKMKTLLNSALEKRENIIKEAIVLASIKPPTEARETLFRAHRMAYAAITPEMQTILDKYYEFGYNEDLLGPIDRRMLRRINNYFYKTVPENKQKYSYGYDYSLVYYPLDDLTDEDEKELNDESYYSNYDGLYYDDPREYSDPDADHELYTRNDLVEWEKQQIDYDYQYVRWSITQTSPGSFAKNVMAHQVYSAVELREKIITDALASISADKSLEEGKAILFGAHKRAFDESQSYLQKALENLNKRPPYDDSEYPKKHLENIERRFRRGLEEYRA